MWVCVNAVDRVSPSLANLLKIVVKLVTSHDNNSRSSSRGAVWVCGCGGVGGCGVWGVGVCLCGGPVLGAVAVEVFGRVVRQVHTWRAVVVAAVARAAVRRALARTTPR